MPLIRYGYATGTFSSRRMARKLEEDVAFRVLGAGNFPAHRTISDIRHRHLKDFESVFVQVVRIAQEVGLVKLGTLAVDGSKVKANASKHKAMSYKRMLEEEARLRREIRELTGRAQAIDEREDAEFGPEVRGDELPAEIARRKGRMSKIRAAKERLEARQREADREAGRDEDDDDRPGKRGRPFERGFGVPRDKAQENFTDSDSRIMKCSGGFEQCYNAQIAVDDEAQMIVAAEVTQQAADVGQLRPVLDAVRSNTRGTPNRLLADAGYVSEENLRSLKRRGIDGYVALGQGEKRAKRRISGRHTRAMQRKMQGKRGRKRYRKHPAFSFFNLYRGDLAELLAGGSYTQEPDSNAYADRYCDLGVTYLDDGLVPTAGEASYWLVTGEGLAGESPLGDGSGVDRPSDHSRVGSDVSHHNHALQGR